MTTRRCRPMRTERGLGVEQLFDRMHLGSFYVRTGPNEPVTTGVGHPPRTPISRGTRARFTSGSSVGKTAVIRRNPLSGTSDEVRPTGALGTDRLR
jgi:hypothetical protein